MAPALHMALVHHPTVDKQGDVATTSVTNLDLHDLSRAARTFGVDGVWIVHPYPAMRRYVRTVMNHWTEGWGAAYNHTRKESMEHTVLADDLGEVARRLEAIYPGREIAWVATSAKPLAHRLTYSEMRAWLEDENDDRVFVLLFGTGWGLHGSVMEEVDHVLDPIIGPTDWNHLSVRAAVAIILDRLKGLGHPLYGP